MFTQFSSQSRIKLLFMSIIILLIGAAIYDYLIQPLYEYLGMTPIDRSSGKNILLSLLAFFLYAINLPPKIKNPSDIFSLVYLSFIFLFSAVFLGVSGKLDLTKSLLLILFNVLSVLLIRFTVKAFRPLLLLFRFHSIKSKNLFYCMMCVVLFIGILAGLRNFEYASFDFGESYARRLAARETLAPGNFFSYIFEMSINGLAPLLAFIAGSRKKLSLIIVAFLFPIFAYWVMGSKSPILTSGLLWFLGYLFAAKQIHTLPRILISLLFCVYLLAALEVFLLESSFIADTFIRRSTSVVWQNQGYFFDYFFKQDIYAMMFGVEKGDVPITFLIGELYYNDVDINVNVNTFMHALLNHGLSGVLLNIVILGLFFSFLDVLYKKYQRPEAIAIAFLFSIHVTEQFYLTTLLSSGIALATLLILLRISRVDGKNFPVNNRYSD